MNKFSKEKFEQVAAENGYEVFTAEDIASYYKDGIQKSLNEQMSENEKKEFVADCMSLAKAILVDDEGNESTVYYRKSQVNWERAEDGTIMKGVAGVYADTPTNRLLGRVGEAYIPDEEFMKSLENDTEDSIAKAARTGRYADTPENRRLHRVGQPYKKRASKGGAEGDDRKPAGKGGKKGGSDKKGGELKKDAWNENISASQLPEKYRKFTENALSAIKGGGGKDMKISAWVSSSQEETDDDTEIVVEGKMGKQKFEVTLQEDGSGEVKIGNYSSEFDSVDDLADAIDDAYYEDDDDDDDDDKKKSR